MDVVVSLGLYVGEEEALRLAQESLGRAVRNFPLLIVTHARLMPGRDGAGVRLWQVDFGCMRLSPDELNAMRLDGEGRRTLFARTECDGPDFLGGGL